MVAAYVATVDHKISDVATEMEPEAACVDDGKPVATRCGVDQQAATTSATVEPAVSAATVGAEAAAAMYHMMQRRFTPLFHPLGSGGRLD